MKKLYSLCFRQVISEIDRIAHRKGMTRSALVNAALAEYARDETTPENGIINDIFFI